MSQISSIFFNNKRDLFSNSEFGNHSKDNPYLVQSQEICFPSKEEILFTGNNLQVNRYYYKDSKGQLCSWEGVEKSTNNACTSPTDTTMCTIAVLKRQIRCDCLLLVRQFRAPIQKYTIEFPATVLSSRDSKNDKFIMEQANKGIKDETGYSSTFIKHVSPATAMDADITDGKVRLVSVTIDGDDPMQNASPKNTFAFESGHGYIVQLLQLPLNDLLERLAKYSEHDIIDSRVYAYAMGLQEGEKIAINNMKIREELNEV